MQSARSLQFLMLAAFVTALAACASGAGPDPSAIQSPPSQSPPPIPDPTPVPTPTPPPVPVQIRQGAQTTFGPNFLTAVTGGGAFPDFTVNAVRASCVGDGVADDTACLQAAANAARDRGKVLAIPATSAFYRITAPITIYTSVGGVDGMPTLQQVSTAGTAAAVGLRLAPTMTGWVYGLHVIGTFDGSNGVGEWAHNIDVGAVANVTISGNILENALGDAIGTDYSVWGGGDTTSSSNVLVDANTLRNPYRCAVAFVGNQRRWVVTNNLVDKQVNYVSGIDVEPEGSASVIGVEIAYNLFAMNNRIANPSRGADGMAVFAWQTPNTPSPGGTYYLHHNYGTFGTGFFGASGSFDSIYQASNAEGTSVPP